MKDSNMLVTNTNKLTRAILSLRHLHHAILSVGGVDAGSIACQVGSWTKIYPTFTAPGAVFLSMRYMYFPVSMYSYLVCLIAMIVPKWHNSA